MMKIKIPVIVECDSSADINDVINDLNCMLQDGFQQDELNYGYMDKVYLQSRTEVVWEEIK